MRRAITTWSRSGGRQHINFYFRESAPANAGTLNFQDYDVFISHKGEDIAISETVGETLYSYGLSPYLDRWDVNADGDSLELDEYLREVIRETPSIIAVITENTRQSWWVPFEVGVARETHSQIATFLSVESNSGQVIHLPGYLRSWPILVGLSELRDWASSVPRRSHPTVKVTFSEGTAREMSMRGSSPTVGIGALERSGKVVFVD